MSAAAAHGWAGPRREDIDDAADIVITAGRNCTLLRAAGSYTDDDVQRCMLAVEDIVARGFIARGCPVDELPATLALVVVAAQRRKDLDDATEGGHG